VLTEPPSVAGLVSATLETVVVVAPEDATGDPVVAVISVVAVVPAAFGLDDAVSFELLHAAAVKHSVSAIARTLFNRAFTDSPNVSRGAKRPRRL
jgi:hypothetical protein